MVGADVVVVDVMRVVEVSLGALVVSGRSASPLGPPLTPQPASSRAPNSVLTAVLCRLRSTIAPRSVASRPYGLPGHAAPEIEIMIELQGARNAEVAATHRALVRVVAHRLLRDQVRGIVVMHSPPPGSALQQFLRLPQSPARLVHQT